MRAAAVGLQQLTQSTSSQFAANDRRLVGRTADGGGCALFSICDASSPLSFRHDNFVQETKVWLEKLSEGQVNHAAAIKVLQERVDVSLGQTNARAQMRARA